MDCYSFDRIISDYIDSNLNVKQKKEANEHIAECPRCRGKLADMINILSAMHSLPTCRTRSDFESRLMERIERQKQHRESPFIHVFQEYSRVISVAAAVMLLVATSVFVYTAVVIPHAPDAVPSAEIRSLQPGATLPASAAGARPEFVSSTSPKAQPDTNAVESTNYNNRIMMVNE